MGMDRWAGLAVALLVVGATAISEAQANYLFGRWEREPTAWGWIGFEWIEFSDASLATDAIGDVPVQTYRITDDLALVQTRFGETYIFEVIGPNKICLPAPKLHALTEDQPADETQPRDCYIRV